MAKIVRLINTSDCFELDSVERKATSESAMKLRIQLHLAGLPLEDTVTILEELDVDRCRTTAHNWIQKADLQSLDRGTPDHVAVDETVFQLDAKQYWLHAAVYLATDRLLHAQIYPRRTTAVSPMFFSEPREKHQVDNPVFLIDVAPWLQVTCNRQGIRFQHETHGERNSVERVFREVKRRTFDR